MMIDFVVGGPARNGDFLYRTDFVEELWDSLRTNQLSAKHPIVKDLEGYMQALDNGGPDRNL